jgi:hypothetical protein
LPAARGLVVVISTAAVGTLITVVAGREPGFVLGFCVLVGAVAASFAVRPGAVYRIIPAPALAYLVGAVLAGLIHDRATDTSRTALAISAAQWTASGFLAMTAATLLAILICAVRWGRYWRRYGAFGPQGQVSQRSMDGSRRAASSRSPGGSRSAAGPRSPAGPRGPGGLGNTMSPRNRIGSRNADGTGSPRRRSDPPGPGY